RSTPARQTRCRFPLENRSERLPNDYAIIATLMKGMASSLPVGAPPRCEPLSLETPASPAWPKFAPGAGAPTTTSQDSRPSRSRIPPPRDQRNAQRLIPAKQARSPESFCRHARYPGYRQGAAKAVNPSGKIFPEKIKALGQYADKEIGREHCGCLGKSYP